MPVCLRFRMLSRVLLVVALAAGANAAAAAVEESNRDGKSKYGGSYSVMIWCHFSRAYLSQITRGDQRNGK